MATRRTDATGKGFTMAYLGRLPAPTTQAWDWQTRAACRGMAGSLFFHPWGERGPARDQRVDRAKQVCAGCPVIDTCRRHALQAQEPCGVWGGLSEEERLFLLNRGQTRRRKPPTPGPNQPEPAQTGLMPPDPG